MADAFPDVSEIGAKGGGQVPVTPPYPLKRFSVN